MSREIPARFDWYEWTADGLDDDRVAPAIALALGGSVKRAKGRNGYATSYLVERDGARLARVFGHSSRAGEVHVETESEACDEVVPLVRRLWPDHRISRLDSAVDLLIDFDAIDERALALAGERGLSHRLVTDSAGGATRYLGAPSSELRVRVYRKSEQLRARYPERAAEVPDGIVRVELQARPGKRHAKEAASRLTAEEVWGLGRWTQEFARELLTIDAPRVSTHFWRPDDWARSRHWLESQVAPVVARRIDEVGRERATAEVLEALGLLGA